MSDSERDAGSGPPSLTLEIAGIIVELVGSERVIAALEEKFRPFVVAQAGSPARVSLVFEAEAESFSSDFHLQEGELLALAADASARSITVRGGGFEASLVRQGSSGSLTGAALGARHLGDVDAILRLALSVALPLSNTLLLHAAAVETRGGAGAIVLAGASGSGKTTATRELGPALSDELVAVRVGAASAEPAVSGTPYWRGQPKERPLDQLVVLERDARGQTGSRQHVTGARAVSLLAPHVARYLSLADIDARVLELLARLVSRRGINRLCCPSGPAYLPFLRDALSSAHANP